MLLLLVAYLSAVDVSSATSLGRISHSAGASSKLSNARSNSWWVEIPGGEIKANYIAEKYGLKNLGKIGSLKDKYTFVKPVEDGTVGSSLIQQLDQTRYDTIEMSLRNDPEVTTSVHQKLHTVVKRFNPPTTSSDPLWQYQWNVNNSGQTEERSLYLDINVIGAWIQGYTGEGIVVGVVDDGVDSDHVDLRNNFDSTNSFDFFDNDDDPRPSTPADSHGTACAGEIAMVRSNGYCGVGVAYDSRVAGIRLLGYGPIVDSQEASSLSHKLDAIDVYSNSWGPADDGTTVEGPGPLVNEAYYRGSTQGRNGLGNIFTWAAGNGGDYYDSCAADGYVQSIYTIPVGAYNQVGGPAYYDEKCSAKMTVAYVDNTNILDPDIQVATIITNDRCTLGFSGTSAATPYVSGVTALALQANPRLTWRDVQYLIVYTSNPQPLLTNTDDYFTNGAGLTVSHHFGFGAIDAEAMVTRAQNWNTVPSQITHTVTPSTSSGMSTYGNPLQLTLTYASSITYLEHITVTLTLNASGYTNAIDPSNASNFIEQYINGDVRVSDFNTYIKRGDIEVSITSPNNTRSTLLFPRPLDTVNTEGYNQWPFLSVLHWGEDPRGQWIINVNWTNPNGGAATVEDVSVQLYGVSQAPDSVSSIPSTCNSLCARGCSGPYDIDCDACNSDTIRNATTLECIEPKLCIEPYQISDGYCYIPSSASLYSAPCVWIMLILLATSVVSLHV